ncbi:MAG: ABC transporter permease [Deltaproteobacteria bacterium]|jgi:phospholipid/cholesterol/gamma-HCH transport system permease protein|nr:ABC transporter permease [Deltaproteobacteria bacterium]
MSALAKNILILPRFFADHLHMLIREIGAMSIFTAIGMRNIFTGKQFPKVLRQIHFIGSNSLFLIALIGFFTGMVLGLQGYYALATFGSEGVLGTLVALSLVRELGPVLTAIMITGRAGSAMTAEIGVMRISEQLDALEVMDINPYGFLVSPRMLASIVVFPLLTSVFNVVGILGGYFTGVYLLGLNGGIYLHRVQSSVQFDDIFSCYVKCLIFAVIVSAVCCYKGFYAHMRQDSVGPEAVSNATTSAVVLSCILILIFDYVATTFFTV